MTMIGCLSLENHCTSLQNQSLLNFLFWFIVTSLSVLMCGVSVWLVCQLLNLLFQFILFFSLYSFSRSASVGARVSRISVLTCRISVWISCLLFNLLFPFIVTSLGAWDSRISVFICRIIVLICRISIWLACLLLSLPFVLRVISLSAVLLCFHSIKQNIDDFADVFQLVEGFPCVYLQFFGIFRVNLKFSIFSQFDENKLTVISDDTKQVITVLFGMYSQQLQCTLYNGILFQLARGFYLYDTHWCTRVICYGDIAPTGGKAGYLYGLLGLHVHQIVVQEWLNEIFHKISNSFFRALAIVKGLRLQTAHLSKCLVTFANAFPNRVFCSLNISTVHLQDDMLTCAVGTDFNFSDNLFISFSIFFPFLL